MVSCLGPQPACVSAERDVTALWDGASEQTLAAALLPPVVECTETGLASVGGSRGPWAGSRSRLGLLVSTATAYRLQLAKVFAIALRDRLHCSPDLHERIHTALHEAVANAILHGNLKLDSALRDGLPGLAIAHALAQARLASLPPAQGRVRIVARWRRIVLVIEVRDGGGGFRHSELTDCHQRAVERCHGSGRGLSVLAAMCDRLAFSRNGATVSLGFRL